MCVFVPSSGRVVLPNGPPSQPPHPPLSRCLAIVMLTVLRQSVSCQPLVTLQLVRSPSFLLLRQGVFGRPLFHSPPSHCSVRESTVWAKPCPCKPSRDCRLQAAANAAIPQFVLQTLFLSYYITDKFCICYVACKPRFVLVIYSHFGDVLNAISYVVPTIKKIMFKCAHHVFSCYRTIKVGHLAVFLSHLAQNMPTFPPLFLASLLTIYK